MARGNMIKLVVISVINQVQGYIQKTKKSHEWKFEKFRIFSCHNAYKTLTTIEDHTP